MAIKPLTYKEAKFAFWDIEVLSNVFTVAIYDRPSNELSLFYRIDITDTDTLYADFKRLLETDRASVESAIRRANPAWTGPHARVNFYDLNTLAGNFVLARALGLSDANQINSRLGDQGSLPSYFRLTCDTDDEYDPKRDRYLCGYNSANYDTTMISLYFDKVLGYFQRGWEMFVEDLRVLALIVGGNLVLENQDVLQPFTHFRNGRQFKSLAYLDLEELRDVSDELIKVVRPYLDMHKKTFFSYVYSDEFAAVGIPQLADVVGPKVFLDVLYRICGNAEPFLQPVALDMRSHNDALFTDEFIKSMPSYLRSVYCSVDTTSDKRNVRRVSSDVSRIRFNMLKSGRHIDVARLNEKQSRVGLKRLLGMLGYQILESDKLSNDTFITSVDMLIDLLAYNASDVINLGFLLDHPVYSSGFELKRALMVEYPESIYNRDVISGQPDVSSESVRWDRLAPDSTSAKFVAMVLAPYDRLSDIPEVSFKYPNEDVAREQGIDQIDVLDTAKAFFEANINDKAALARFMEVYNYYDSIRGHNFNESNAGDNLKTKVKARPTNLPYFLSDGTPTSCFATFSTGGLHGAEANVALYELENAEAAKLVDLQRAVVAALGLENESEADQAMAIRKAIRVTLPSGQVVEWKDVLVSSSSPNPKGDPASVPRFKQPKRVKELFPLVEKDGNVTNALNDHYTYTSVAKAIHEDFSSYYPLLLTNMAAFYNASLGEDRYKKLYDLKQEYGKLMKDPTLSEHEREIYKTKRAGVKLLLNSASGAGDQKFKSNIQMNNRIISMRLIGQLFTWMIGQRQTLEGARIVSSNTDGLYATDIDFETNQRTLDEMSKIIHVLIEPETLFIASKDTNNRLEIANPFDADGKADDRFLDSNGSFDPDSVPILAASGSSLACWQRPDPTKSLDHPAVLDTALAYYLRRIALTDPELISKPVDFNTALTMMENFAHDDDSVHALLLFQNVIASSLKSYSFVFASDPVPPGEAESAAYAASNPRALQHYNRAFIVKPGTPGSVSLRMAVASLKKGKAASGKTVSSRAKKLSDKDIATYRRVATEVIKANGFADNLVTQLSMEQALRTRVPLIPLEREIKTQKVRGIDPTWPILIVNRDLRCMSESERRMLISQLNLDIYAQIFVNNYAKSWMNVVSM